MKQARRPADSGADSVRAEAAAWVARLQGPGRTPETERAFRGWLDSDSSNAPAFDKATEVWEALGGIGPALRRRRLRHAQVGGALVAAGLAGVIALVGWRSAPEPGVAYATVIGEQKAVALSDGSHLMLNTDSRVVVRYSQGRRLVELERGEAAFDVAKNPKRPFLVEAEGQEVRAVGTSFVVLHTPGNVRVTLLEGKVTVRPSGALSRLGVAPVTMAPGERWSLDDNRLVRLDGVGLEAATAWRAGEIVLNDTPLAQAVAEMNRYSRSPILVERPETARLRVSGIFDTGESESFAHTIATLYGLKITDKGGAIRLGGLPQSN